MTERSPSKVFASKISARSLAKIYEMHVRTGVARGRDGRLPESLNPELLQLSRQISQRLHEGTYRFTQYRELLSSKGANKFPRVISVPTARDRITLKALADFLGEVYPYARGTIPQVPVRLIGEEVPVTTYDGFIRIDVRNFYPTIPHDKIRTALGRRIRKAEILAVLMAAVETPTVPDRGKRRLPTDLGVPQGLAISNIVSELVMMPVDVHLGANEKCSYFRFVDDILILCDHDDVEELWSLTVTLLEAQGLDAHPREGDGNKSLSGKLSDGIEYLGYRFSRDLISVRQSTVNNLEARLAREFTRYRKTPAARKEAAARVCINRVNLAITGCIYRRSAYGWLAYFRQMNDLKLLKELDVTVQRFVKRFEIPPPVHVKTFTRAYWSITHPHGRDADYVPNYDNLSINRMREVLSDYLSADELAQIPGPAIPRTFRRVMVSLTSELERDVGSIS